MAATNAYGWNKLPITGQVTAFHILAFCPVIVQPFRGTGPTDARQILLRHMYTMRRPQLITEALRWVQSFVERRMCNRNRLYKATDLVRRLIHQGQRGCSDGVAPSPEVWMVGFRKEVARQRQRDKHP